MKAYPTHTISKQNDLNEVSTHWTQTKLKFLLSLRSGTSPAEDKNVYGGKYRVFGANGVIGYCGQANLNKKSILIGRVGASGEINLSDEECWVTDNALIVELKGLSLAYAKYLLLSLNLVLHQSSIRG